VSDLEARLESRDLVLAESPISGLVGFLLITFVLGRVGWTVSDLYLSFDNLPYHLFEKDRWGFIEIVTSNAYFCLFKGRT
jgi:hypothetical protein